VVKGESPCCQGKTTDFASEFIFLPRKSGWLPDLKLANLGVLFLQFRKGLSKDDKPQKLTLQHWLEAVSVEISSCDSSTFH
jgi:hypothetical protein